MNQKKTEGLSGLGCRIEQIRADHHHPSDQPGRLCGQNPRRRQRARAARRHHSDHRSRSTAQVRRHHSI